MRFFKKRDKSKARSTSSAAPATTIASTSDDQRYVDFRNPTGPQFAVTPAPDGNGAASSLPSLSGGAGSRSRGYRGLRGFGSGGSGGIAAGSGCSGDGGSRQSYARGGSNLSSTPVPPLLPTATIASVRTLLNLPDAVLARIFGTVCLHSQDRSYEKCEDSSIEDGCMLCDMRDLAHCVQVCHRWKPVAERVLYTSIRIDSVHYCDREAHLADKRKRRSFFDRNGQPEDTAQVRLKLLCRTLRDDPRRCLGPTVQFLKIPYMLRESQYADIARTVSVLPNLRYVDLPEGLFMDEPVYLALALELRAKCPDLRKMTYMGSGAAPSLEALASGELWPHLEVLELVRVAMDPALLRHVLSCLTNLRALKVIESASGPHSFSDDVLVPFARGGPEAYAYTFAHAPPSPSPQLSSFSSATATHNGQQSDSIPALEELALSDASLITEDGIVAYLGRPDVRRCLKVLTLNGTGVRPWSLQAILAQATSLRHLTIVDEVSVSLPIAANTRNILPLSSQSLRTLNYEIKAAGGHNNTSQHTGVTRSYYNYLSGSILSGGLPNLRAVYVRDAEFPDALIAGLPLPMPPGVGGFTANGTGSNNGNGRPGSAGSFSAFGNPMSPRSPTSASGSNNSSILSPIPTPTGFLSPRQSTGFPAPAAPRATHNPGLNQPQQRQLSTQNPFTDSQSASPPPVMSLQPPPKPWAASSHNPRFSSNNPFAGMISPQQVQMLEVFTKGDDDIDWSSIVVSGEGDTMGRGQAGSMGRPVSSYGLGPDIGAGGARKSVLVNTGAGGFLAVPDGSSGFRSSGNGRGSNEADLWPRPKSSSGEKKSEKRDLWR